MPTLFDVAIVGLGAMGSAAACHLAQRGVKVLGLDRYSPPHPHGSSHGGSRVLRQAYYEHPHYVPLVQRAFTNWASLEQEIGRSLFRQTGCLMIGPTEGSLVAGAKRSAEVHHLPYELVPPDALRRRFPMFTPPRDALGLLEVRAGVLFPEACIEAHLEIARRYGARLQLEEPVIEWQADGGTVTVVTSKRTYHADRLLLTAGAWTSQLTPDLDLPLTVERQVTYWIEPAARPGLFESSHCPVFMWEYAPGMMFYGVPNMGDGVKVGLHHQGETTDPDKVRRDVSPGEEEAIRGLVSRFMPDADGPLLASSVCLYTNTPDHHFLIHVHPGLPQILIASPCSGHGFKFASVIGEILADLLTLGRTSFDIGFFQLDRLG